ncbi:MAG: AAA family ATPase, partial [Nitrospira sp. SB0677_bin_15]|nr:AAA family ATPase [Nitrospira sp. SB0677_bin_15]
NGFTNFLAILPSAYFSVFSYPILALSPLRGLVVLDEIQRRPDLFPTLRVLSDRPRRPARFLVLGSAPPDLLRQSSETRAGRIAYHELPGFSLSELGESQADLLWLRGGFPRSFIARSHRQSYEWRGEFIHSGAWGCACLLEGCKIQRV